MHDHWDRIASSQRPVWTSLAFLFLVLMGLCPFTHASSSILNKPTAPLRSAGIGDVTVIVAREPRTTIDHLHWLSAHRHLVYNQGAITKLNFAMLFDSYPLVGVSLLNVALPLAYLSYIVDYYDNLSNITVFTTSLHNVPGYTPHQFRVDVERLDRGELTISVDNDGFLSLVKKCANVWDAASGMKTDHLMVLPLLLPSTIHLILYTLYYTPYSIHLTHASYTLYP